MRTTRRTLANTLRAEARADVPPPSATFIDDLEQRLFNDASIAPLAANVLPFRRRVSRGVAIGVVAAVVSGAGAAAVAIVRESRTGPATVEPTITQSVPDTTEHAPTSSIAASTTTSSTTTPTTPTTPTTTGPVTDAPGNDAPVVVAVTVAPVTTDPPAPEPAASTTPASVPPSTEVQHPATMDLACTAASGAITCTWSPVPDGTDHVILLRSTPADARGRVLMPPAGATSFVDANVTAGQPYTYLVHAMDASGQSLAHSTFAQLTCCG